MSSVLHFQEPGGDETSLLTALLGAAAEASSGGAIFAWSNVHGARALLDNPGFEPFLKNSPFELLVGTDTITDPKAIATLEEQQTDWPLLTVKAFVHGQASLFHPKMAWFRAGEELRLIVGSANLTRGGLQANWEVFTTLVVVGTAADELETQISTWIEQHKEYILDLSDPRVAEAVAGNVGYEGALKKAAPTKPDPDESKAASGTDCLVAEIPKNRKDRLGNSLFSQANFSQAIFESFFQMGGGENEVLLYHVAEDGSLGELESRQGKFKPASRNYYFELGAAAGVPHSGTRPPVGVFLHLQSGAYLYLYRLPGESGYAQLDELLNSLWTPRGNQGRRVEVTRDQLAAAWPECPLLSAPEPDA
ncbi:phospholipase D family protein [Nocardioides antri]|nr:phospholipase D family protein [Nocardioides antri]